MEERFQRLHFYATWLDHRSELLSKRREQSESPDTALSRILELQTYGVSKNQRSLECSSRLYKNCTEACCIGTDVEDDMDHEGNGKVERNGQEDEWASPAPRRGLIHVTV